MSVNDSDIMIKEKTEGQNMNKKQNVVVFDLDGTLMDTNHREELREAGMWDGYNNECHKDTPIKEVVALMNEYYEKGHQVWIMTGRSIEVESKTIKSLEDAGANYHFLKMRGVGVKIPDYNLKPSWIVKYIGAENVVAAFDDREKVIENFKKKGVENIYDVTKGIPKDLLINKIETPDLTISLEAEESKIFKKQSMKP